MKMHVLSGGRLRLRKNIYLPDADRSETIDIPVSSMLLRHRQGNVLFDTGCHPSVVGNAEARWGAMAKYMTPIMGPSDNVIGGLATLGLGPADIDLVVNSHFHPDHCGCNSFFTKATVMVHAEELAAAKGPDSATRGYLSVDWDHPIPMDTVSGERDLFGDSRIVLVPLPGHTVGSMGALVVLERSGTFLLAADAVSLRVSLDKDIIPRNTWNKDALVRSFDEIRRVEESGATIICGHDSEQWNTLRKGADAYD